MKFSAIFALGALVLPAIASPFPGNIGRSIIDKSDIIANAKAIVSVPITVDQKREVAYPISNSQDIIEIYKQLLDTVMTHTGAINQTVASVPVGTVPTEANIVAIKVQLNLIVDAVKAVVIALGGVVGVIKFTPDAIQVIVGIVIAIVVEIAATLLLVIKTLKIEVTLAVFISNISQILAGLIFILEHIVGGGIVKLVLNVINLPFVLQIVNGPLAVFIKMLGTGKIIN